jgi:hypothetical protein
MAGPASIIGAVAVRVARLTANGTPDYNNPQGGFLLCGGISTFEHDFQIQAGKDIFEEDAAGNACVVRKKFDRTKFTTFKLTMCRTDYRLAEILGTSTAVTLSGTTVGHAVKVLTGCGTQVAPFGVSLELWSEQWDCDAPMVNQPYQRAILPRCYLTPKGYKRENGVSLPVFDGYSTSNPNWGDGPFGDADVLAGITGWCYAEIDEPALPVCQPVINYINIPGAAS